LAGIFDFLDKVEQFSWNIGAHSECQRIKI